MKVNEQVCWVVNQILMEHSAGGGISEGPLLTLVKYSSKLWSGFEFLIIQVGWGGGLQPQNIVILSQITYDFFLIHLKIRLVYYKGGWSALFSLLSFFRGKKLPFRNPKLFYPIFNCFFFFLNNKNTSVHKSSLASELRYIFEQAFTQACNHFLIVAELRW